MINVCHHCGIYRADKIIDPEGPYAICPECGFKHPFQQMPLLIVSGASGAGKSTVCNSLVGKLTSALVLDSDILWRPEFNRPEVRYRDFFETWLRMCKNISKSGLPVVMFGAGFGVPENIEPCIERRYFSQVHYLALVCSDEALAERLLRRPAWRGSGEQSYIENHQSFNRWFKAYSGQPPVQLLDTTGTPVEQTVQQVRSWIELISFSFSREKNKT